MEINDQQKVSYAYDNLTRMSSRTLNTTTPFTTSIEYMEGDTPGSTTTLVKSIRNGDNTTSYTYDALGNIETISENGELKATYHYDELNQLVREDSAYVGKTTCYEYDGGGNILSKMEYEYTLGEDLGPGEQVGYYQYGNGEWKDQLTKFSTYPTMNGHRSYDAVGNLISVNDDSYSWTRGRLLSEIYLANNRGSYTYEYDDSGIRTSKTVDGVKTEYYLNGSAILSQVTGNDRMDFYYDDGGKLIGFKLNNEEYYYIRNAQSDITGILDSSGVQVVSYVYDSWGKLVSTTGTLAETVGVQNPYRYRGYYFDTESQFYYLQSRYYDPEVGRFISADDLSVASLSTRSVNCKNLYSYCDNNPVNCLLRGGMEKQQISLVIFLFMESVFY